eukprot:Amastigsp_a842606_27.p5 type:complete len:113 gc:universal Amastigsp_a842606_27:562-224(-)
MSSSTGFINATLRAPFKRTRTVPRFGASSMSSTLFLFLSPRSSASTRCRSHSMSPAGAGSRCATSGPRSSACPRPLAVRAPFNGRRGVRAPILLSSPSSTRLFTRRSFRRHR